MLTCCTAEHSYTRSSKIQCRLLTIGAKNKATPQTMYSLIKVHLAKNFQAKYHDLLLDIFEGSLYHFH